jgi:hypothetical protein
MPLGRPVKRKRKVLLVLLLAAALFSSAALFVSISPEGTFDEPLVATTEHSHFRFAKGEVTLVVGNHVTPCGTYRHDNHGWIWESRNTDPIPIRAYVWGLKADGLMETGEHTMWRCFHFAK